MPPGPSDRHDEELWVPLRFSREEINRHARWLLVIARLKSGVSIARAQQEMNAITLRIANRYPEIDKHWGASVEPLKNDFLDPNRRTNLWLLLSAVSFVLLIACLNIANLLLARATTRQRELAVRAALGASGTQLFWQLLIESLTLAAFGGVLGIVLSEGLLKVIPAVLPPGTLSSEADVRLSAPVLLFTLATTALSAVLFSCAPTLQARKVDLNEGLKQGGLASIGAGRPSLRQGLVVVEFALALTLLAAAALTIHSFANRMHVDLGIRTDHILTFYLPVPQSRVAQPQQTENFYRDLLARIEAIPGVQKAGAGTDTPLDDANLDMSFSIAGGPVLDLSTRPEAGFQAVTPGYFGTFGIRVDRGRVFTERDTATSARVVMVNETFAHQFLNGVTRLSIAQLRNGMLALGPRVEWRIVGVFRDVQNGVRLGKPKLPQIYVPFVQSPWPQAVVAVRTTLNPTKMSKPIAAAVHSLNPDLPLVKREDDGSACRRSVCRGSVRHGALRRLGDAGVDLGFARDIWAYVLLW
jgi:putative ABC transport system permease protein